MSDEQKKVKDPEQERLEEAIMLGKQAEALINHPLHRQARMIIEDELVKQTRATSFEQHEIRTELWRKQQVVNWYESIYARIVRDGATAEKTLLQRVKDKVQKFRRVI